jgi:hypothetical protein
MEGPEGTEGWIEGWCNQLGRDLCRLREREIAEGIPAKILRQGLKERLRILMKRYREGQRQGISFSEYTRRSQLLGIFGTGEFLKPSMVAGALLINSLGSQLRKLMTSQIIFMWDKIPNHS